MASAISAARSMAGRANGWSSSRQSRLTTLVLCLFHAFVPAVKALPVFQRAVHVFEDEDLPKSPADASLWIYLSTAMVLVLLGGVFAGLTIALMGQDEIYLQVIATSGEGSERKNAKSVLRLLKGGKHWVLVTLLLSNVITNETLPIVLDRSLGGGWPAVVSSTVLIVIFGEVVPQSICVRYGLPIGAWMAPIVRCLMYLMAPIAWPTAKLLDYLLGEDHGTTYKKAGLKTLVTLHKTLGTSADDRLNEDEVTIITAVLDLKAKAVGSIMTPIEGVFTMSADTVLDEPMMDTILSAGYSRIPIHTPDSPGNFVGMLLVKMLITYDPEDALRVRDFALATLPETRTDTSCLDIINFFQQGKSHMVLVSDFPGEPRGAVGVVTLEDVIEELIGEEIIDESDVFIDVHKAIRRMAPAPRTRIPKGEVVAEPPQTLSRNQSEGAQGPVDMMYRKASAPEFAGSPNSATTLLRRRSADGSGSANKGPHGVPLRSNDPDILRHLKHLGPSNAANRPKSTRINTVKIKPGIPNTIPEHARRPSDSAIITTPIGTMKGGVGEGLFDSAGREASDGVHTVAVGYGTMTSGGDRLSLQPGNDRSSARDEQPTSSTSETANENTKLLNGKDEENNRSRSRAQSVSTIGSLRAKSRSKSPPKKRHTARSGSISENIVDVNGVKKIVLETTSSSDSEDRIIIAQVEDAQDQKPNSETEGKSAAESKDSKKKRKKRGKKKRNGGDNGESQSLLGGHGN